MKDQMSDNNPSKSAKTFRRTLEPIFLQHDSILNDISSRNNP